MLCGITTAPRPNGVSYLKKTTESLLAAWAHRIHIFAEPGVEVSAVLSPSGLENSMTRKTEVQMKNLELPLDPFCISLHFNDRRLGNWANWLRCASYLCAVADIEHSKSVLVSEDDCLYSERAIPKASEILRQLLITHGPQKVGFLALYTSSLYQEKMTQPVEARPTKSMWGACSLLFPTESLHRILDCDKVRNWTGIEKMLPPGHPDIQHADTCIGEAIIELGMLGFFMKPGLAQHIGEVSSLRTSVPLTGERKSKEVA